MQFFFGGARVDAVFGDDGEMLGGADAGKNMIAVYGLEAGLDNEDVAASE